MDPQLAAFARHHGGVFDRPTAQAAGYSDAAIRAMVRRAVWRRVRRGVYCDARQWATASPAGRHVMLAHAVALSCDSDTVFSHATGAMLRGWPVWNVPFDTVSVTRTGDTHAGRLEAGVHHFKARLPRDQVETVDGLPVCSKERLMVDAARAYGFEQAVVIADSALRDGADRDLAMRLYLESSAWPHAAGAGRPIRFGDGRAANPGESRLRVRLHLVGFTGYVPQQPLYGRDGRLLGYGDLVDWENRTLIEFDGRSKYGIDGLDPRLQVIAEKEREDAIREELGFEVIRVMWDQLEDLDALAARVHRAHARSARRRPAAA